MIVQESTHRSKQDFDLGKCFEDLRSGDAATVNRAMSDIITGLDGYVQTCIRAINTSRKRLPEPSHSYVLDQDDADEFWWVLYQSVVKSYNPDLGSPQGFVYAVLRRHCANKFRSVYVRYQKNYDVDCDLDQRPEEVNDIDVLEREDFIKQGVLRVVSRIIGGDERKQGLLRLKFGCSSYDGMFGAVMVGGLGGNKAALWAAYHSMLNQIKKAMPRDYKEIIGARETRSIDDFSAEEYAALGHMKSMTTEQLIALIKADVDENGKLKAYPDNSPYLN